ncbi:erythromycin esterase family protein [candidate division KSB1 bacterium]|nr:erythromycin esterase family protein [candidate division KSB1 bacterium]
MKRILFSFLTIIVFGLVACQREAAHEHDAAKLHALQKLLVPIRTIDAADENFDDLQPLKTKWQNARIILLGEATHGDGAAFAAKVRLIKFLHREMGFEILAFESGFYDCEKAWSLIKTGTPAAKAAQQALFGLWSESRQVQPVFDYLDAVRDSARPLQLTGFDLQFSGSLSRDSLLVDLGNFLRVANTHSAFDTASWLIVRATLDTLFRFNSRFRKMSSQQQENFYSASQKLREWIAALPHDARDDEESTSILEDTPLPASRGKLLSARSEYSPLEAGPGGVHASHRAMHWLQLLRSTETLLRFLWNADFSKPDPKIMNLRDQQMGENLLWLARAHFPNKKIIVWAATSHSSRNRQNIRSREGGKIGESEMIPMGDYLWRELGGQTYVLGFIAQHGKSAVRGRAPWDIAESRAGSLEDWLAHSEYDYALLDWRSLPTEAHWLADTLLARPMGFVPMRARWPEIMDGVLFIREMRPSAEIE